MWKEFKYEIEQFVVEFRKLDKKVLIVFLSSIILLTFSWYFSTPEFFKENFSFQKRFNFPYPDLTSFTYWFLLDSILFLIIPLLIIKFIFHEDIKNFGVNWQNINTGLIFTLLGIIFFIPVIYFLSKSDNFIQFFPLMKNAKEDFLVFIIYEFCFIIFIFSWEFFFRGFMLFGLEKNFGIYAIFIQMIPFVILHNGKPFIETLTSIFGAIILGYFALRTRSIYYGFFIHVFILVSLDIIAFIMN